VSSATLVSQDANGKIQWQVGATPTALPNTRTTTTGKLTVRSPKVRAPLGRALQGLAAEGCAVLLQQRCGQHAITLTKVVDITLT
jgi:hypothetical protein